MTGNGFRGSQLPPARRVAALAPVGASPASPPPAGAPRGPTNEGVLAEYLAAMGAQDLNLVVLNAGGRSETDAALADLFDLLDLLTLRTSHGREPSTFNKELLPGIFMSPTPVQEAVGEWGIQGAVDALQEGIPTLGPRPLAPPPDAGASPMMWLLSAGDPRLGEELYAAMDRAYRPHRHMWSHAALDSDTLLWAVLTQLRDDDLDVVFPDLRRQTGYSAYLQRSERFVERLSPQTGIRTS